MKKLLTLLFGGCIMVLSNKGRAQKWRKGGNMEKYTLYVGLNDKDSKMQEVTTIDAYKTVRNICLKQTDGVTISEAEGVYTHENGTVVIEKTLRIEMLFVSKESVKAIVNEIKTVLNQESVAVQFEMVNSELW